MLNIFTYQGINLALRGTKSKVWFTLATEQASGPRQRVRHLPISRD